MAVLKQIQFGSGTATPIAMTQVAIDSESSKALSVVAENNQLSDNADPLYTIALAVDGKTITKTGNDGLATALKLSYHAAVTTEGSEKGAYIALEDIDGHSIASSEIPVSSIIGNGVLDSSSYDSTTGILTLTFKNADGTTTDVEIDLKEMFDIDDIIIDQTTGKDYLSFTIAGPTSYVIKDGEEGESPITPAEYAELPAADQAKYEPVMPEQGQGVLNVKLADVTYTATSGSTHANLTVNSDNGKMLDATDAIPAVKSYVDDVVSHASTDLAVTAQGDDYVGASVDAATDNKHVVVETNVQDLTATAGTPGTYNASTGAQETAPVAGTLTGVADSLADSADIATKVKTYVDGAIAIEVARSDAKNKADITALDYTDTAVEGQYVSEVSETDGKIAVTRADVSGAVLKNYSKGNDESDIASTDTINKAFSKIEVRIDNNEETTAQALNDLDGRLNAIQYQVTGTTLQFFGIAQHSNS